MLYTAKIQLFAIYFGILFLQVIKNGEGVLVVARRPVNKVHAWKFIPCTLCLLFCHKDSMHMHVKHCPLRINSNISKQVDSYQDGMLLIETFIPSREDDGLDNIIEGMKDTKKNEGWLCLI